MVSDISGLRAARAMVEEVRQELGLPPIEVGIMIEVPSAALMADIFAPEVDFFSIGTNDLIQYTLACDRSDPSVANLYRSGDPSILRMIRMVVEAAARHDRPVTVCGQMSSDPRFVPLLLGLGIRQLSATPHSIPRLKEVITHISIPEAERIAEHACALDLARDVEHYLLGELGRICPDLVY